MSPKYTSNCIPIPSLRGYPIIYLPGTFLVIHPEKHDIFHYDTPRSEMIHVSRNSKPVPDIPIELLIAWRYFEDDVQELVWLKFYMNDNSIKVEVRVSPNTATQFERYYRRSEVNGKCKIAINRSPTICIHYESHGKIIYSTCTI